MYAVIGASGYLGSYILRHILESTDDTVLATARVPRESTEKRLQWAACDVTKAQDVARLNEICAQKAAGGGALKVVYLVAYHHPDLVDRNPGFAWDVNITSLSRFLNQLANVSCLYYASTESVYGESVGGYRFKETDALHPVNRYGVQKSVAEKLVTGYGYQVVRFPFLIGPSLVPGRKHFYDEIAETITSEKTIDMFQDSYHNVLDFDTAANLLIQIIESKARDRPQTLNICSDSAMSKYDVGIRIARRIGADEKYIHPISIRESGGIFEAKRASSTLMDNTAVKSLLGIDSIEPSL